MNVRNSGFGLKRFIINTPTRDGFCWEIENSLSTSSEDRSSSSCMFLYCEPLFAQFLKICILVKN